MKTLKVYISPEIYFLIWQKKRAREGKLGESRRVLIRIWEKVAG